MQQTRGLMSESMCQNHTGRVLSCPPATLPGRIPPASVPENEHGRCQDPQIRATPFMGRDGAALLRGGWFPSQTLGPRRWGYAP